MAKKVFFGGKFEDTLENGLTSLENDYRTIILEGIASPKRPPSKDIYIRENLIYSGPFHEEPVKGSCSEVSSVDCESVAYSELKTTSDSDIMVALLGIRPSVGTACEIIQAFENGTDIAIFYIKDDDNIYHWENENWFLFETLKYKEELEFETLKKSAPSIKIVKCNTKEEAVVNINKYLDEVNKKETF